MQYDLKKEHKYCAAHYVYGMQLWEFTVLWQTLAFINMCYSC
jgi:hypothetical protein